MGLECHDDVFEFQCSVYDLYNRGGDIDQQRANDIFHDQLDLIRSGVDYVTGEFVDNLRDLLDDDERADLDDILAQHYIFDVPRNLYHYRPDDVSG